MDKSKLPLFRGRKPPSTQQSKPNVAPDSKKNNAKTKSSKKADECPKSPKSPKSPRGGIRGGGAIVWPRQPDGQVSAGLAVPSNGNAPSAGPKTPRKWGFTTGLKGTKKDRGSEEQTGGRAHAQASNKNNNKAPIADRKDKVIRSNTKVTSNNKYGAPLGRGLSTSVKGKVKLLTDGQIARTEIANGITPSQTAPILPCSQGEASPLVSPQQNSSTSSMLRRDSAESDRKLPSPSKLMQQFTKYYEYDDMADLTSGSGKRSVTSPLTSPCSDGEKLKHSSSDSSPHHDYEDIDLILNQNRSNLLSQSQSQNADLPDMQRGGGGLYASLNIESCIANDQLEKSDKVKQIKRDTGERSVTPLQVKCHDNAAVSSHTNGSSSRQASYEGSSVLPRRQNGRPPLPPTPFTRGRQTSQAAIPVSGFNTKTSAAVSRKFHGASRLGTSQYATSSQTPAYHVTTSDQSGYIKTVSSQSAHELISKTIYPREGTVSLNSRSDSGSNTEPGNNGFSHAINSCSSFVNSHISQPRLVDSSQLHYEPLSYRNPSTNGQLKSGNAQCILPKPVHSHTMANIPAMGLTSIYHHNSKQSIDRSGDNRHLSHSQNCDNDELRLGSRPASTERRMDSSSSPDGYHTYESVADSHSSSNSTAVNQNCQSHLSNRREPHYCENTKPSTTHYTDSAVMHPGIVTEQAQFSQTSHYMCSHSNASSAGSLLDVVIPAPTSGSGSHSSGIDQHVPPPSGSYHYDSNVEFTSSSDCLDRNIPANTDQCIVYKSTSGSSIDTRKDNTNIDNGEGTDTDLTPMVSRKNAQNMHTLVNNVDPQRQTDSFNLQSIYVKHTTESNNKAPTDYGYADSARQNGLDLALIVAKEQLNSTGKGMTHSHSGLGPSYGYIYNMEGPAMDMPKVGLSQLYGSKMESKSGPINTHPDLSPVTPPYTPILRRASVPAPESPVYSRKHSSPSCGIRMAELRAKAQRRSWSDPRSSKSTASSPERCTPSPTNSMTSVHSYQSVAMEEGTMTTISEEDNSGGYTDCQQSNDNKKKQASSGDYEKLTLCPRSEVTSLKRQPRTLPRTPLSHKIPHPNAQPNSACSANQQLVVTPALPSPCGYRDLSRDSVCFYEDLSPCSAESNHTESWINANIPAFQNDALHSPEIASNGVKLNNGHSKDKVIDDTGTLRSSVGESQISANKNTAVTSHNATPAKLERSVSVPVGDALHRDKAGANTAGSATKSKGISQRQRSSSLKQDQGSQTQKTSLLKVHALRSAVMVPKQKVAQSSNSSKSNLKTSQNAANKLKSSSKLKSKQRRSSSNSSGDGKPHDGKDKRALSHSQLEKPQLLSKSHVSAKSNLKTEGSKKIVKTKLDSSANQQGQHRKLSNDSNKTIAQGSQPKVILNKPHKSDKNSKSVTVRLNKIENSSKKSTKGKESLSSRSDSKFSYRSLSAGSQENVTISGQFASKIPKPTTVPSKSFVAEAKEKRHHSDPLCRAGSYSSMSSCDPLSSFPSTPCHSDLSIHSISSETYDVSVEDVAMRMRDADEATHNSGVDAASALQSPGNLDEHCDLLSRDPKPINEHDAPTLPQAHARQTADVILQPKSSQINKQDAGTKDEHSSKQELDLSTQRNTQKAPKTTSPKCDLSRKLNNYDTNPATMTLEKKEISETNSDDRAQLVNVRNSKLHVEPRSKDNRPPISQNESNSKRCDVLICQTDRHHCCAVSHTLYQPVTEPGGLSKDASTEKLLLSKDIYTEVPSRKNNKSVNEGTKQVIAHTHAETNGPTGESHSVKEEDCNFQSSQLDIKDKSHCIISADTARSDLDFVTTPNNITSASEQKKEITIETLNMIPSTAQSNDNMQRTPLKDAVPGAGLHGQLDLLHAKAVSQKCDTSDTSRTDALSQSGKPGRETMPEDCVVNNQPLGMSLSEKQRSPVAETGRFFSGGDKIETTNGTVSNSATSKIACQGKLLEMQSTIGSDTSCNMDENLMNGVSSERHGTVGGDMKKEESGGTQAISDGDWRITRAASTLQNLPPMLPFLVPPYASLRRSRVVTFAATNKSSATPDSNTKCSSLPKERSDHAASSDINKPNRWSDTTCDFTQAVGCFKINTQDIRSNSAGNYSAKDCNFQSEQNSSKSVIAEANEMSKNFSLQTKRMCETHTANENAANKKNGNQCGKESIQSRFDTDGSSRLGLTGRDPEAPLWAFTAPGCNSESDTNVYETARPKCDNTSGRTATTSTKDAACNSSHSFKARQINTGHLQGKSKPPEGVISAVSCPKQNDLTLDRCQQSCAEYSRELQLHPVQIDSISQRNTLGFTPMQSDYKPREDDSNVERADFVEPCVKTQNVNDVRILRHVSACSGVIKGYSKDLLGHKSDTATAVAFDKQSPRRSNNSVGVCKKSSRVINSNNDETVLSQKLLTEKCDVIPINDEEFKTAINTSRDVATTESTVDIQANHAETQQPWQASLNREQNASKCQEQIKPKGVAPAREHSKEPPEGSPMSYDSFYVFNDANKFMTFPSEPLVIRGKKTAKRPCDLPQPTGFEVRDHYIEDSYFGDSVITHDTIFSPLNEEQRRSTVIRPAVAGMNNPNGDMLNSLRLSESGYDSWKSQGSSTTACQEDDETGNCTETTDSDEQGSRLSIISKKLCGGHDYDSDNSENDVTSTVTSSVSTVKSEIHLHTAAGKVTPVSDTDGVAHFDACEKSDCELCEKHLQEKSIECECEHCELLNNTDSENQIPVNSGNSSKDNTPPVGFSRFSGSLSKISASRSSSETALTSDGIKFLEWDTSYDNNLIAKRFKDSVSSFEDLLDSSDIFYSSGMKETSVSLEKLLQDCQDLMANSQEFGSGSLQRRLHFSGSDFALAMHSMSKSPSEETLPLDKRRSGVSVRSGDVLDATCRQVIAGEKPVATGLPQDCGRKGKLHEENADDVTSHVDDVTRRGRPKSDDVTYGCRYEKREASDFRKKEVKKDLPHTGSMDAKNSSTCDVLSEDKEWRAAVIENQSSGDHGLNPNIDGNGINVSHMTSGRKSEGDTTLPRQPSTIPAHNCTNCQCRCDIIKCDSSDKTASSDKDANKEHDCEIINTSTADVSQGERVINCGSNTGSWNHNTYHSGDISNGNSRSTQSADQSLANQNTKSERQPDIVQSLANTGESPKTVASSNHTCDQSHTRSPNRKELDFENKFASKFGRLSFLSERKRQLFEQRKTTKKAINMPLSFTSLKQAWSSGDKVSIKEMTERLRLSQNVQPAQPEAGTNDRTRSPDDVPYSTPKSPDNKARRFTKDILMYRDKLLAKKAKKDSQCGADNLSAAVSHSRQVIDNGNLVKENVANYEDNLESCLDVLSVNKTSQSASFDSLDVNHSQCSSAFSDSQDSPASDSLMVERPESDVTRSNRASGDVKCPGSRADDQPPQTPDGVRSELSHAVSNQSLSHEEYLKYRRSLEREKAKTSHAEESNSAESGDPVLNRTANSKSRKHPSHLEVKPCYVPTNAKQTDERPRYENTAIAHYPSFTQGAIEKQSSSIASTSAQAGVHEVRKLRSHTIGCLETAPLEPERSQRRSTAVLPPYEWSSNTTGSDSAKLEGSEKQHNKGKTAQIKTGTPEEPRRMLHERNTDDFQNALTLPIRQPSPASRNDVTIAAPPTRSDIHLFQTKSPENGISQYSAHRIPWGQKRGMGGRVLEKLQMLSKNSAQEFIPVKGHRSPLIEGQRSPVDQKSPNIDQGSSKKGRTFGFSFRFSKNK